MRLSHVNSARIILCKFRAFNCTIFPNTNLVEKIILPQSLHRFGAVVYGKSFMVNWMDSIIERIRSTCMIKRKCIRFIFIPSQISYFCDCHWVKLFLINSASSFEGGGERRLWNRRQNIRKFLSLPLSKNRLNLYRIYTVQKSLRCPQNAA